MAYLALLPALHVEDAWIRILPHLMKGEEHWKDFYTVDQIRRNLITGIQQVWVMVEGTSVIGCVLTQIDEYPAAKVCRISYLGGTGFKRRMMEQMQRIERWARDKGCSSIDILGRKEWAPLLQKTLGYRSPGLVYRKEL